MSEHDEAKRQRRFHEHITVLVADLDAAYRECHSAMRYMRDGDGDTSILLNTWMHEIDKMRETARRMREESRED